MGRDFDEMIPDLLELYKETETNRRDFGEKKWETVKFFTAKHSRKSSRALGWDTKSKTGSSAGKYFDGKSFGHTGYTGTSVWVDLVRNLFVVFLTNRVYPTRENKKIIEVRPKLHDVVVEAID